MTPGLVKTKIQNHIKQNKRHSLIAALICLLILIVGLKFLFHYYDTHVTTDDANIEGDVIYISSQVTGTIQEVIVQDNQEVQQGDVLIVVDHQYYDNIAMAQQARLKEAKSKYKVALIELKRLNQLAIKHEISEQELDNKNWQVKQLEALVTQAKANLNQARLDQKRTKITSPTQGFVTKLTAKAGAYVNKGQPILAVVPKARWVIANYKETQLTNMKPGQKVTIEIDAYPKLKLKGHVDSIQKGTGARFSLLPPENATGNFIKVVQRVPVKILIDDPIPEEITMAPGMSVVPTVLIN